MEANGKRTVRGISDFGKVHELEGLTSRQLLQHTEHSGPSNSGPSTPPGPPPTPKAVPKPLKVSLNAPHVPIHPPPVRVRLAYGEALQQFREQRHKDWTMTRTSFEELQNPENFFQSGLSKDDFCKLALYAMTPDDEDKMNPYRVAGRLPAIIIPGDHGVSAREARENRRGEASELPEIGGAICHVTWMLATQCVELWKTLMKDSQPPGIRSRARDCALRTAMEMQRGDQALGKPVDKLRVKIDEWIDKWGAKEFTATGSPEDAQAAFRHVTDMRDETIAIQRAAEDISIAFDRLAEDWNRLYIASLYNPVLCYNPSAPDPKPPFSPELREKFRLMGEKIIKGSKLVAQAYATPIDVCRTMLDSYDRLHKECFIGIIRREAAMGWANIWKAQWTRFVEAHQDMEIGKKLEEML